MSSHSTECTDKVRKQADTYDYISTAYHEAGHVICAFLHYFKVDSVLIFKDKVSQRVNGFTYYNNPLINDNSVILKFIKSEICLKYAGLIAERYQFKQISGSEKYPSFLKDGSSGDTLSAAKLIRKYNLGKSRKARYSYKKKMRNETLQEVKNNWEAITIVAHELFKKKRLSFDDLKIILTSKGNKKEFWKLQFEIIENIFNNSIVLDNNNYKYILGSK